MMHSKDSLNVLLSYILYNLSEFVIGHFRLQEQQQQKDTLIESVHATRKLTFNILRKFISFLFNFRLQFHLSY